MTYATASEPSRRGPPPSLSVDHLNAAVTRAARARRLWPRWAGARGPDSHLHVGRDCGGGRQEEPAEVELRGPEHHQGGGPAARHWRRGSRTAVRAKASAAACSSQTCAAALTRRIARGERVR